MGRIKPIRVFREPPGRTPAEAGLSALLNLGPKTSVWLTDAGIRTRAQLEKMGPIEACRRVRAAGHPVNVLLAYALEGGLSGTPWNQLPAETKTWLRTEFARMRRAGG